MSVLSLWESVRMEVSVSTLWGATPVDVRSSGREPTVPLMWTSVRCRSVRMVLPVSTHLEDSPVSVHLDGKGRCVNKVGIRGARDMGPNSPDKSSCLYFWNVWISLADKNECLNATLCQNNALCINTQGSFTCQCPMGWEGKYCHIGMYMCKVLSHKYVQTQSTVT